MSRGPQLLRWMVIGLSALGIVGAVAYAIDAARDIHYALQGKPFYQPMYWASVARFALAAAAATGLLFYLLGWLRRLYSDDVRAERDLERYRYDIDRASWAIETILEAQAKEAGEVPVRWIEGVTHGLFSRVEEKADDGGGLQALGDLLSVAAKAKIGPSGTEIEINKPGLRKLANEGS